MKTVIVNKKHIGKWSKSAPAITFKPGTEYEVEDDLVVEGVHVLVKAKGKATAETKTETKKVEAKSEESGEAKADLESMSKEDLIDMAETMDIEITSRMTKAEIITAINEKQGEN